MRKSRLLEAAWCCGSCSVMLSMRTDPGLPQAYLTTCITVTGGTVSTQIQSVSDFWVQSILAWFRSRIQRAPAAAALSISCRHCCQWSWILHCLGFSWCESSAGQLPYIYKWHTSISCTVSAAASSSCWWWDHQFCCPPSPHLWAARSLRLDYLR